MIRVLESYKNLPSWFTRFLDKKGNNYLKNDLSSKLGIDLYNCEFQSTSNHKDPRFKDPNYLVIVDLSSSVDWGNEIYLYKMANSGKYINYNDVRLQQDIAPKSYASKNSVKTLINLADHIGFIDISASKKMARDKYYDPRYNSKGDYAGQYKSDYDGNWHTIHGRDKSGYVIPDPAKLVAKLYQFNIDNTAEVLDNYYKKISKLKNRIFDIDIRSISSDDGNVMDSYERCMREFASLSNSFLKLEKDINKIISEVGTDEWNTYRDKRNMTDEEYFQERLEWDSYYKRELDNSIHNVLSYLKKLENL